MKISVFPFLMIVILFLFSCSPENYDKKESFEISSFPDVLNVKNIPVEAEDWSAFCFSDLGNWQGYALPPDSIPAFGGSFPGPFLMTHGRWLSKALLVPVVYDVSGQNDIRFRECLKQQTHYFPGRLEQKYQFEDFRINLTLIFVSSQTALIRTSFINHSESEKRFKLAWQGDLLISNLEIRANHGAVTIILPGEKEKVVITPDHKFKAETFENSFKIHLPEEILLPGSGYQEILVAQSLILDSARNKNEKKLIMQAFKKS